MIPNLQYDYNFGPHGPLAPLHARAAYPDHPAMIAPPIGWIDLVVDLHERLVELLPDYTIAQVKEKFAGLRFYVNTYGTERDDPRVSQAYELIAEAEHRSQSICQVCGEPGSMRSDGGWFGTFCDAHSERGR
jgi:hypothetical protein